MYKPFWKGLNNKQSWNHSLESLFVNIVMSYLCLQTLRNLVGKKFCEKKDNSNFFN